MSNKKKATKLCVESQVKAGDPKTRKKVEVETKFYSRENSQSTCPKCKSDDCEFDGDCPFDISDSGDGEASFHVFLICKKCGLAFEDIWEAHYVCTEGEEDAVVGDGK